MTPATKYDAMTTPIVEGVAPFWRRYSGRSGRTDVAPSHWRNTTATRRVTIDEGGTSSAMARIVEGYDPDVAPSASVQLPTDSRRIVVRGTSGSGKTTLARTVAAARGIPHVELDGIFHQAGWTPLDDERFRAAVAAFMDDDRWVVCGGYSQVAPL